MEKKTLWVSVLLWSFVGLGLAFLFLQQRGYLSPREVTSLPIDGVMSVNEEEAEESFKILPQKREALLQQVGLSDELKTWRTTDKDLLVLQAARWSLEKLHTSYPQIPMNKLDRLRNLVHERSAGQDGF